MRLAQLGQQYRRLAGQDQGVAADAADRQNGHARRRALSDDLSGVLALLDGDEIAGLVFSKQRRVSRTRRELRDFGAHVARERHFRQRDGETAVREIMRRADAPGKHKSPNEVAVPALGGKIDRRRRAIRASAKLMRIG